MNWKSYRNGNYTVKINLDNGTKIRETTEDAFIPEFAESIDLCIGRKCDGGCPYCYENATPDGKNGELLDDKLINSFHPYTEVAINGNSVDHPQLEEFLKRLKKQNVIANMTVNQIHFEREEDKIRKLIDNGLVSGLGISLRKATPEFVAKVKQYPNAVIHVINGILDEDGVKNLLDNNLKILILGYKFLGRGKDYALQCKSTKMNMDWLYNILPKLIKHFAVVSFDNLAIDQLNVKRIIPAEKWDEFYMGNDGDFTFYIDMASRTFGKSSLLEKSKMMPMMSTVDEMFDVVRSGGKIHG